MKGHHQWQVQQPCCMQKFIRTDFFVSMDQLKGFTFQSTSQVKGLDPGAQPLSQGQPIQTGQRPSLSCPLRPPPCSQQRTQLLPPRMGQAQYSLAQPQSVYLFCIRSCFFQAGINDGV